MEDKNLYTICIYTENQIGLLAQFSNMFTRRNLNIMSLNAQASSIPGVHFLLIVAEGTGQKVHQLVHSLEKRVDVIKVFEYEGDKTGTDQLNLLLDTLEEVRNYLKIRTR
ncbi:MAG: hypothetical protein MJY94_07525 [Bacteroidales bacterium]|nr:hypothetical protein [Bacteroidales bacterium]